MPYLVTQHNAYRNLLAYFSLSDGLLFPLTPRPVRLHAMQPPAMTLLPEFHPMQKSHIGEDCKHPN